MRGFGVPALVAALIVAGCGGGRTSSPPITEPSTSTPAATGETTATVPVATDEEVTGTAPSSSTPSTPVTVAEEPPADLAVLRPDGVGAVDFGTPADDAIAELSAILGAPDRVEVIEWTMGCVEDAGWLDCVRELRLIDEGRLIVWDEEGLEVALVDTSREGSATALQFGDWHVLVAPGDTRLTTPEGIHPGMTVGALTQAVPGVEFGYNEGLLDIFYVDDQQGGGYWGRLDWNPSTAEIDRGDIAAVQAALNDHGAALVVDGVWGTRTEAAWLEFLAEQGIEPFTSQLWLTPEIGKALGLPPDDITLATIAPRPLIEPAAPSSAPELILRTDGLGRFDFGEPANKLVDELTSMFGPPTDEVIFSAPPPDRLYMPGGYQALHELAQYEWSDPHLLVVVGDTPYRGHRWDEPIPGSLHLITWETASEGLQFSQGLGVGSALAELRSVHPNVIVGQWNICETEYDPDAFRTPAPVFPVRGRLDWDWVRDLQAALNSQGAHIDVDGIYGPATTAAARTFQQAEGIDETATADGPTGQIGPVTLAALGVTPPDSAPIRYLAAGYPGSC